MITFYKVGSYLEDLTSADSSGQNILISRAI